MKSLLTVIMLLLSGLGCRVHERTYYTIYTPAKPLTNNYALVGGAGVSSNASSGINVGATNQSQTPVR